MPQRGESRAVFMLLGRASACRPAVRAKGRPGLRGPKKPRSSGPPSAEPGEGLSLSRVLFFLRNDGDRLGDVTRVLEACDHSDVGSGMKVVVRRGTGIEVQLVGFVIGRRVQDEQSGAQVDVNHLSAKRETRSRQGQNGDLPGHIVAVAMSVETNRDQRAGLKQARGNALVIVKELG